MICWEGVKWVSLLFLPHGKPVETRENVLNIRLETNKSAKRICRSKIRFVNNVLHWVKNGRRQIVSTSSFVNRRMNVDAAIIIHFVMMMSQPCMADLIGGQG